LAEQFLERGSKVVISGRSKDVVDAVAAELTVKYGSDSILGIPCDVREFSEVERLWQETVRAFGKVDIWINNAGISQAQIPFSHLEPEFIQDLIETNLIGAAYGAKVALTGFKEQGFGALYNMEGLGSDGRQVEGLGLYATSKYGLAYLTDYLAAEVKGTPLIVGAIQPGMVLTDLILDRYQGLEPEEWESARKIFNILAEKVDTVVPFLADQVLENGKNGARIAWLTPGKIFWRFFTAPFSKRDLFGF
jgi:NAD(P)-dependent dehydrogenase (short-subunit alcohol dehydrogenase family)